VVLSSVVQFYNEVGLTPPQHQNKVIKIYYLSSTDCTVKRPLIFTRPITYKYTCCCCHIATRRFYLFYREKTAFVAGAVFCNTHEILVAFIVQRKQIGKYGYR